LLVIANAALYALFMIADIGGFRYSFGPLFGASGSASSAMTLPTTWLKYASICICFILSVCVMRSVSQDRNGRRSDKSRIGTFDENAPHRRDARGRDGTHIEKISEDFTYRRDARLQVVIFAFTLAADFLILFTPHFTTGIAVFCGAHLTATYRYAGAPTARKVAVIAGAVGAAIVTIATTSGVLSATGPQNLSASGSTAAAPLLYAAAATPYALLIAAATVSAYRRRQARANNLLSRLGMTLFVLCDINVLLWNLRRGIDMTEIPSWTGILIWTFYLPAQTMLALSAYDFETSKERTLKE
jgi:hypothetical protein